MKNKLACNFLAISSVIFMISCPTNENGDGTNLGEQNETGSQTNNKENTDLIIKMDK
jgi:hypothetical protein